MAKLTLRRRTGKDGPLGRTFILIFTLTALPAWAAAPSDARPVADERCDVDGQRAGRMRRYLRARLVPELGARAVVDQREAAVFAWIGWPLDRPLPRGLASSPSLTARRRALAEQGLKLRRARADHARGRAATLRDAVDSALDLEQVEAELGAFEACP
jgi:hypothetical protein